MSPPQNGTAGLRGFRAIRRSGPDAGMDPHRLWPTLPASSPSGCSASALLAAPIGRTRGACRPRLRMPPASRHTPAQKHADGDTVVCSSRSFPQPIKSGSVSLKCPACREICTCNRHSCQVAYVEIRHSAFRRSEQYNCNGRHGQSLNRQLFLQLAMKFFIK
jgi:hypothetical protein